MKELTLREACALISEGKWQELEFGDNKPIDYWWRAGDETDAVYNCSAGLRFRHNPYLPKGEISLEQAREAVKAGKRVEFRSVNYHEWTYMDCTFIPLSYHPWDDDAMDYRFRLAPEPTSEPRRVPLGPEDVLVTTQFAHVTTPDEREDYCIVNKHGVRMTASGIYYTWERLAKLFKRTDDSGRTWQPCWKEVEG